MSDASFQYLVLAWLTALTLPWVVLAFWVSRGGPKRLADGVLGSLEPCENCGGFGFILDAGQSPVTCPDCRGWRPPLRGAAGPPDIRSP